MKVYYCKHCGNVVLSLVDKGPTPVCCGEKMELLNANSVDAATEKHVPEVIRDGETLIVKVGAVELRQASPPGRKAGSPLPGPRARDGLWILQSPRALEERVLIS